MTLGGSTIAAAAGVDPWVSPLRQWLYSTGRAAPETTEAMRLGTRLQPFIFEELRELGHDAAQTPGLELTDPERPWLVGHPDGIAAPHMVVAAKATGRPHETLPAHWEAQVQTYLRLNRSASALVAQLGGLSFTTWEVEYDPQAADALLHLADEFWRYVERDEPPPPMGHGDERPALLLLHPEAEAGRAVRETRTVREARRELRALLEAESARAERIERLRAVVTGYMGTAETLLSAQDETVARWANVQSRRLDTKRLRAEQPDVYDEYAQVQTTRRLTLS